MTDKQTHRDNRINIRLKSNVRDTLELAADARGLPVSTLVANICGEYAANVDRQNEQMQQAAEAQVQALTATFEKIFSNPEYMAQMAKNME